MSRLALSVVEPGFSLVVVRGFSLVLALLLWTTSVVLAHEGHDHKVMGTVAKIQESQLEVKATDGKTVTVTLNDQTKILRGKQKTAKTDIKEGERVVVIYNTAKDKRSVAKEVRLAAQTTE
jgi:hypothetical protein